jgi:hypothetical protein
LVRRLLALTARDDVALMALQAEAAAALGTFDLGAFRKELTARLRVSGFVDWRGAGRYARRADAVLDVLESLLAGGRAADVVTLTEHVMARLDTAMGHIDDSGGYLQDAISRVADLHHAACVAARPEPRRRGAARGECVGGRLGVVPRRPRALCGRPGRGGSRCLPGPARARVGDVAAARARGDAADRAGRRPALPDHASAGEPGARRRQRG